MAKTAEYYTSDNFGPVKKIAEQTETGPATTILKGISAGMISVAASVVLLAIGIGIAYWGGDFAVGDATGLGDGLPADFGGLYGIAIAAIGMLATTGVVVSVDAYGPIADDAGGIAEMAKLDPSVREVTDALDCARQHHRRGRPRASPSARPHSPPLRCSRASSRHRQGCGDENKDIVLDLDIGDIEVFLGLFIGAMLPFLFAGPHDRRRRSSGVQMIEEVRSSSGRSPVYGKAGKAFAPTRPVASPSPPRPRCGR